MSLDSVRQLEWLSQLLRWFLSQNDARPAPAASPLLRSAPHPPAKRIEAINWTYQAASQHAEFRQLVEKADTSRDQYEHAQAELQYWQALRIFPLHGGYRVQYAHCLKEQQKYPDAFIQYWYALGLGAPQHDVEEHVLFAARHAGIAASASDVGRRAAAFAGAQRAADDWEAAPIEKDFKDFAGLFWGDHGPLTSAFVIEQLLACHTRKALFIKYISAPETIRRNRPLFVMLNQKGLPDV